MRSVPGKGIQTLCMAPTRELAEQVANELRKFAEGYRP
jgi:superfamily II DNA/RNA helicase